MTIFLDPERPTDSVAIVIGQSHDPLDLVVVFHHDDKDDYSERTFSLTDLLDAELDDRQFADGAYDADILPWLEAAQTLIADRLRRVLAAGIRPTD